MIFYLETELSYSPVSYVVEKKNDFNELTGQWDCCTTPMGLCRTAKRTHVDSTKNNKTNQKSVNNSKDTSGGFRNELETEQTHTHTPKDVHNKQEMCHEGQPQLTRGYFNQDRIQDAARNDLLISGIKERCLPNMVIILNCFIQFTKFTTVSTCFFPRCLPPHNKHAESPLHPVAAPFFCPVSSRLLLSVCFSSRL